MVLPAPLESSFQEVPNQEQLEVVVPPTSEERDKLRSRAPGDHEAHREALETFWQPLWVLVPDVSAQQPGVAWGRRRVVRAPKASREPGSPAPRATPLAVPPPTPGSWAGRRAAWVRTCVCRAHSPSQESVQSPPHSAPARGFPSPSSEIPPRAPCPLCQGEKAAEPETKKLLPASTLRPSTRPRHSPAPSLDPGDIARAHAGGRDLGTGSRVGESAFPTPRGYSCPCTPPGDAPRQPRPHHPLPKASRAPDTATPSPNRQHYPSS